MHIATNGQTYRHNQPRACSNWFREQKKFDKEMGGVKKKREIEELIRS